MDNSNNAGGQRQKRVLPSRSRRGGPGIGSCDVDVMILDTQKRKGESEPLIPVNTPFLLTTNSSFVPSTSPTSSLLAESAHPNARYFDRVEVAKAFKEQQVIQTPEFSLLSEQASVSSRFRPRSSEDETADTSDAAYEKRHRKYETFEKRQRLREKEKLKHEQYKLKERIEQLRAMDGAAFLALPSSSFSPVPGRLTDDAVDNATAASLPGAHADGTAAAHDEGERRQKEMLDVALALVERYRTLLPTERKGLEKDKKSGGMNSFSEPEFEAVMSSHHGDDTEMDMLVAETAQEQEKIKLKIPARLSRSSPQTPKSNTKTKWQINQSPPMPKSKSQMSSLAHPLSLTSSKLPPFDSGVPSPMFSPNLRQSSYVQSHTEPSTSRPTTPRPLYSTTDAHTNGFLPEPITVATESISHVRPRKRKKHSAAAFLLAGEESRSHLQYAAEEDLDSTSPARRSPSVVTSYAGAGGQIEYTTSLLLISAYRNFNAPKARKTQRHVTAFGYKVPAEIDHWKDFELPAWLIAKDDIAEGLEVEGQLLAGVDMDASAAETSIVEDVVVSSAGAFIQLQLEAGGSESGQDHISVEGVP